MTDRSSANIGTRLRNTLLITLLAATAYVVLEWLFLVTAPSFMSSLSWPARIEALLGGSIAVFGTALVLVILAAILALPFARRARHISDVLLSLPFAIFVTLLGVLLVDNFTNTVFGWGIGVGGFVGTLAYVLVLVFLGYRAVRWGMKLLHVEQTRFALLVLALPVAGVAMVALSVIDTGDSLEPQFATDQPLEELPNIIFFAADGVPADYVSAYGHELATTPALETLLPRSLVAEHMYSNSARTTGAVTAMMTGRYPTTTKVLYPPHSLTGLDAYFTLPRLLRQLGYVGIQESVRYYADAGDLNWRESFDAANNRKLDADLNEHVAVDFALQNVSRFLDTLLERITLRIDALFSGRPPANSAERLMDAEHAKVYGMSDEDRIRRVIEFIRQADKPFFAHIHLMETHCCGWWFSGRHFARPPGLDEEEKKMYRFRDALRDSDELFQQLLDELDSSGELDNTIIVYSSDHGLKWRADQRLPLIIRFPDGEHAGRISKTVQLIDIAPTILDYLNVDIPEWIEGRSLLDAAALPPERPVFQVTQLRRSHFKTDKKDTLAQLIGEGPPFYGMKIMAMMVCGDYFEYSLGSGKTSSRSISGELACDGVEIDTEEATRMIRRHLEARGFVKREEKN